MIFLFLGRRVNRPNAPIHGIKGLSLEEIQRQVREEGARFVKYKYVWSALIYSQITDSDIFFITKEQAANCCCAGPAKKYQMITSFLGWWGLFGIVYSIWALIHNCTSSNNSVPITRHVLTKRLKKGKLTVKIAPNSALTQSQLVNQPVNPPPYSSKPDNTPLLDPSQKGQEYS